MRMHSYSTFSCDRFDHCDNLEIMGSSMVNSFQGIGFFYFLIIILPVLLISMGMKGATSNNNCIWCKIHKNETTNC